MSAASRMPTARSSARTCSSFRRKSSQRDPARAHRGHAGAWGVLRGRRGGDGSAARGGRGAGGARSAKEGLISSTYRASLASQPATLRLHTRGRLRSRCHEMVFATMAERTRIPQGPGTWSPRCYAALPSRAVATLRATPRVRSAGRTSRAGQTGSFMETHERILAGSLRVGSKVRVWS